MSFSRSAILRPLSSVSLRIRAVSFLPPTRKPVLSSLAGLTSSMSRSFRDTFDRSGSPAVAVASGSTRVEKTKKDRMDPMSFAFGGSRGVMYNMLSIFRKVQPLCNGQPDFRSLQDFESLLIEEIMSDFQTVCKVNDIPQGEGRTVQVGGKLIALFNDNGDYRAIDDTCPHMGASLSGGYLENGIVTCPWHAWRYRLSDGAWADNPKLKIGCYAVRVEGDQVQIQVPASNSEKKA